MSRLLAFLSRTPRLLFALWLVVAMTQPAGAHACPVHDRALLAAMSAHGMAMVHHAAHEMPAHEMPAHGSHSHAECHCLGDCSTGVATPLPSVASTVPAPAFVLAERPPQPLAEQAFETPARLLPPATAPPTPLVG